MAKVTTDSAQEFKEIKARIEAGDIKPVYLLFGKEHYYIDQLCSLLMERVIPVQEKDFGEIVLYGADVSADQVVSTARQFPMMVSRQLVVVKEAQMMKKVEDIGVYFEGIMPSTVLVICHKNVNDPTKSSKSIDKRSTLYKQSQKYGVAFESNQVQDYKMPKVIEGFYADRGLSITPDGAALLAEFSGTDLQKIALSTDKLMKSLPAGTSKITAKDIESNVGMSREYSTFELTKALSQKEVSKCFRIVHFYAESPKRYPLVVTMAALSSHFIKILRYGAQLQAGVPKDEALAQMGINPYFAREYDVAINNYPIKKTMKIISLLKEYDVRSKSNGRGSAEDGDLLLEVVSKILA